MKPIVVAALALSASSSLSAQVLPATAITDFSTAMPAEGSWSYTSVPGGSEVTFRNAAASPQLVIRCARATRQMTISRPAPGAVAFLSVWTSNLSRNLPASFNPATGQLSATITAFDPILDSIAFSRGRSAYSIAGQAPLVVPAWSEAARVVEDCRT